MVNNNVSCVVPDVKIEETGDTYKLALAQTHNIYNTAQGNRTEVVKELTLAEYKKKPRNTGRKEKEVEKFGGIEELRKEGNHLSLLRKAGHQMGNER